MAAAPDDWRRMGQEGYLTGVTLTLKNYQALRFDWEHEHCVFCYQKFLDPNYSKWARAALAEAPEENIPQGYTNVRSSDAAAGTWWICAPCFEDFKDEFAWRVVDSDPDAWPYDPPEPHPRPTADGGDDAATDRQQAG